MQRTRSLYEWGSVVKSHGGVLGFPPLLELVWLLTMEPIGLLSGPLWRL